MDHPPNQTSAHGNALPFVLGFGQSSTNQGIDKDKAKVLEIALIWSDLVLDVQHHQPGATTPIMVGGPDSDLPFAQGLSGWRLFYWEDGQWWCRIKDGWAATVGKHERTSSGIREVAMEDGCQVVIEMGDTIVVAQMVHAPRKVSGPLEVDPGFIASLSFLAFLCGVVAMITTGRPSPENHLIEAPERVVEMLLHQPPRPVVPQFAQKIEDAPQSTPPPAASPSRGSGRETPGHVELTRSVGILGVIDDTQGVFTGGLHADITAGVFDLVASNGPTGPGGLGSRGSGLGNAGNVAGVGTVGALSPISGGPTGGLGPKREGKLTSGGEPTVFGSALDRSQIDGVIKRHLNQIKYCYQRELTKNPDLQGGVTMKFVITGSGSVSKAKVKRSTLGNAAVEGCISQRFLRLKFPEPKGGGIVLVTYPLLFSAG